jgi:hypothetical protein
MAPATVGEIRSARVWVQKLAARHKGVRMAFLTCRMLGKPEVGWDFDFAVILDELGDLPTSKDGQVDLNTGNFSVCFFLLGRDISQDALRYYVETYDMKPLWIREGAELPALNAAQREAVQDRQAEALWGE